MKRVALVTGGNRGIGFAICSQLALRGVEVVLASRNSREGRSACMDLHKAGLAVHHQNLDVSRASSIRKAVHKIHKKFGRIDILINNAGILVDLDGRPTPSERFNESFITNTLGPYLLCEAILPLMKRKRYGRIVNVSSNRGQMANMNYGAPAYCLSKLALNGVTKIFASEGKNFGIKVNSMCPGRVATRMSGPQFSRSPGEGADTAVWLALLPKGGPNGGFFFDRKRIPW